MAFGKARVWSWWAVPGGFPQRIGARAGAWVHGGVRDQGGGSVPGGGELHRGGKEQSEGGAVAGGRGLWRERESEKTGSVCCVAYGSSSVKGFGVLGCCCGSRLWR